MDSCYKFLFTRFITAHNLLIIQCSTQYAQCSCGDSFGQSKRIVTGANLIKSVSPSILKGLKLPILFTRLEFICNEEKMVRKALKLR